MTPAIRKLLARRALFFAGSITAMIAVLGLATGAYSKATERTTFHTVFADALDPVAAPRSLVTWDLPDEMRGRQFRQADADVAGLAMTSAWVSLARIADKGVGILLEDHFDGVALARAQAASDARQDNREMRMVIIGQNAKPRFFHPDGSVLSVSSDETVTVRYALKDGASQPDFLDLSSDCTRTVLLKKAIGWKVAYHERQCSNPISVDYTVATSKQDFAPLKGVNYYPADAAWSRFWKTYDRKKVAADFDRMHALGANALRFFVPYAHFSAGETRAQALADLDDFLSLADANGLQAVPTLFDLHSGQDESEWGFDFAYLKDVLAVISRHRNVEFVDLKNEPDLDFAHYGEARTQTWLMVMLALARREAPQLKYTIGWSNPVHADRLAPQLDILSYHEFGEPEGAAARLDAVLAAAGGKPVVVTETGYSSFNAFGSHYPSSRQHQAQWLSQSLAGLGKAGGVFVWSLNDHTPDNAAEIAARPWQKYVQAEFGLFALDGTEKPAARVFAGWTPPTMNEPRTHK